MSKCNVGAYIFNTSVCYTRTLKYSRKEYVIESVVEHAQSLYNVKSLL